MSLKNGHLDPLGIWAAIFFFLHKTKHLWFSGPNVYHIAEPLLFWKKYERGLTHAIHMPSAFHTLLLDVIRLLSVKERETLVKSHSLKSSH